jgi:hypothetical protein
MSNFNGKNNNQRDLEQKPLVKKTSLQKDS